MEDDLVLAALNATIDNEDKVLILIVVEDDLVRETGARTVVMNTGLNPYCSGR